MSLINRTNLFVISLSTKAKIKTNPFDYFDSIAITKNEIIREQGQSMYLLFEKIGIVGVFVSLVFCGIQLMFAENGSNYAAVKKKILVEFIILVALSSSIFFAGVIFNAAKSFW